MTKHSFIEEVSLALFSGAIQGTEMALQDKTGWERQYLEGPDKDIFRECLIMRLFGVIRGVRGCVWSDAEKTLLLREIHIHFVNWLHAQNSLTESELDKNQHDLVHKYAIYEHAFREFLEDDKGGLGITASRIVCENLRNVLSSKLNIDDLFDLLRMSNAFLSLVTSYSEQTSNSLNDNLYHRN